MTFATVKAGPGCLFFLFGFGLGCWGVFWLGLLCCFFIVHQTESEDTSRTWGCLDGNYAFENGVKMA